MSANTPMDFTQIEAEVEQRTSRRFEMLRSEIIPTGMKDVLDSDDIRQMVARAKGAVGGGLIVMMGPFAAALGGVTDDGTDSDEAKSDEGSQRKQAAEQIASLVQGDVGNSALHLYDSLEQALAEVRSSVYDAEGLRLSYELAREQNFLVSGAAAYGQWRAGEVRLETSISAAKDLAQKTVRAFGFARSTDGIAQNLSGLFGQMGGRDFGSLGDGSE